MPVVFPRCIFLLNILETEIKLFYDKNKDDDNHVQWIYHELYAIIKGIYIAPFIHIDQFRFGMQNFVRNKLFSISLSIHLSIMMLYKAYGNIFYAYTCKP